MFLAATKQLYDWFSPSGRPFVRLSGRPSVFFDLLLLGDIPTLHDCPSQMNENLLISNSKLTSDSELIWWR